MNALAMEAHDTVLTGGDLTAEQLEYLIGRGGRDSGPSLLHTAWTAGKITDTVLAEVIGGVWSMADRPDRELSHDVWRDMFDAAGFTLDGERKPRPTERMLLFRGSVPERRADWSWTTNFRVAMKYADAMIPGRSPGSLWICQVPPAHMLAINTQRDEDEIVVDTRGLDIREGLR